MPRKIAYQNGNISSLTCYNVEASNPGCFSTTVVSLSSTRTISLSFANAGNCLGAVLMLYNYQDSVTRSVTVTLQENVASVWTDRASKTLTKNEICNSATNPTGVYTIDFVLSAGYPIDITVGKWRWSISQGSGSGNWSLLTSNGTIPFHDTWCNNTSTFTSGTDALGILTDIDVTVDGNVEFIGDLGSGETARAVCGYSCRSTDVSKTGVHGLIHDDSSSLTMRTNGVWITNAFTPVLARIGQGTPVSIANKLTIELKAPTYGTVSQVMPATMNWTAPAVGKGIWAMEGERRSILSGTLTAQANSGQPTISVDFDPTSSWVVGDTCWLDFATTNVASENYVISSMTSSTITFTTNLTATYSLGAKVYNVEKGIVIKSDSSTNRTFACGQVSHLDVKGVHFSNIIGQISISNTNQQISGYADSSVRSAWVMDDCSIDFTTTTYFFQHANTGEDGFTTDNCVINKGVFFNLMMPVRVITPKRFVMQNCTWIYTASRATLSSMLVWTIQNCRFFGGPTNTNAFLMGGTNYVFKDNYIKLYSGGLGGFAQTGVLSYTKEWRNNTFDTCSLGLVFVDTGLVVGMKMQDDVFTGSRTYDYNFYNGCQADIVAKGMNGILNNISSVQSTLALRSKIIFENYEDTDYRNIVYTQQGTKQYTGASLPDTEVRVAGTYNLKLEPISLTNGIYHDLKVIAVPNRQVVVTGFIKKNTNMTTDTVQVELYLPGLIVGEDTPSDTYTIPDTNDWEPFTLGALYPSTEPNQFATLRIIGYSNTASAGFYIADIYNGTNDITNFKTYDNGEPSPIMFEQLGDAQATAGAVWGYSTSNAEFSTAGAIGVKAKKSLTVPTFLGLR